MQFGEKPPSEWDGELPVDEGTGVVVPSGYMSSTLRCIDCPVGKFQGSVGKMSCSVCEHFDREAPPVACTRAPTAAPTMPTPQPTPPTIMEKNCHAGSALHVVAVLPSITTACRKCSPGKHQEQPGQMTCEPCPKGTFNPDRGQYLCTPCNETGRTAYQPLAGQRSCGKCKGTRVALADAVSCVTAAAHKELLRVRAETEAPTTAPTKQPTWLHTPKQMLDQLPKHRQGCSPGRYATHPR
jgi:hypothetical protein